MDLDVIISTTEGQLDMKAGLDTMQGISNSVRTVVETILSEEIQKKKSSKDKVRTNLKKSFKGSYGHIFSINVHDDVEKAERFASIGEDVWSNIITCVLRDSVYLESPGLCNEASNLFEELPFEYEDLLNQIRYSCLKDIHQVAIAFNETVTVRSHHSNGQRIPMASFDRETARTLNPIRTNQTLNITAVISRLNIHTGNGRLQLEGSNETVAFGFGINYKSLQLELKRRLSANLDQNNGIDSENWTYLNLRATPIRLRNGKTIKYIIKSNEE